MGKLSAIAERITAKKAAHDAKADEWAVRLDALDKIEPTAFAMGDAAVAEREVDLSDMEADMRKLTNGAPLQQSPPASTEQVTPRPGDD